jgi:LPS-assembly lipoprotein
MSWSRLASCAAAALVAASLSGCFQPLYSEAAHPGIVEEVRAIEVQPIPSSRIGHYLVENLISDLNGTGDSPPPKYRLVVTITTGQQTPTVNSEINVASSATMIGDADFTLVKIDGGKQIFKAKAFAAAAYDRTTQRYSNMRAARDAEIRLARDLSLQISTQVAAALAVKPS